MRPRSVEFLGRRPKTETDKLQHHKLIYLDDRVEDLLDPTHTVNRDD